MKAAAEIEARVKEPRMMFGHILGGAFEMVYFLPFVFTVVQCFLYHLCTGTPCWIQDDKKEEIARPKPSSKYDKGEEKQKKATEKLEKEPEAKKETKASKDLKEATLNEPKSGTDSHFSAA